jgi:hypothetical protein
MITAKKAGEDKEIAEWLGPAFDLCALKCSAGEERRVHIRNEFKRYRDEFCRIACDDIQVVQLRQDLYDLIKRRCPALDIVVLTLLCTRGVRRSRIDILHENGITDSVLRKLKKNLAWCAEILEALIPRLPDTREKTFSTQPYPQRARCSIEALPDTLRTAVELLENSGFCERNPAEEAIAENEFLFYLYLLLAGFGHKVPTLSRILRAMRIVQHNVSPNDEHLHNIVVVRSGKRKGEKNDRFSQGALNARIHGFRRDFPVVAWQMRAWVAQYTSDTHVQRRKSDETILTFIRQGQEEDARKDYVKTDCDRLRRALKLSGPQSAEILPILYKSDSQALKIVAPFLERRRHISQFADVNSKLEQITRCTNDKIRRVLNSGQKKKFDRMEQNSERALKRELEQMEKKASRKL